MNKFARRGIVFGVLLGIVCLVVPMMHASAITFEEALRKEQATLPLGPQAESGASSEPISTIQHNPTDRVAPSAVAAPAGETIYITRYLPDIIKGAKGPAEMVFLFYKYLMGLVGIVAVGVIMYGGVLRTMSADPSKIRASNEYIKSALKGIVLLFGAQVLFNTINPNIIDIGRIQRALQPSERLTPGALTLKDITILNEDAEDRVASAGSETGVQKRLSSVAGITLRTTCTPGGTTVGCISLDGVKRVTVEAMESMGKAGIPMTITSVTEGSHAEGKYSHANGYKWDMSATLSPDEFTSKPDRFQSISVADRSDSTHGFRDKATGAECFLEKARTYTDNNTGKTVNIVKHWDCQVKPNIER